MQDPRDSSGNAAAATAPSSQPAIPDATDWRGKDDAANPRNFSAARKAFSTAACTFLAFVSTLAASMYSAGSAGAAAEFGIGSSEVAQLPLALFNLGLAFGPLLGSPLSETAGRRAVVLATTPAFAAFTLGAGFARSFAALTICRFFAGVCAAPAVSVASATICDYTAGRYRSVVMSFYYAVPTFGALAGPLVGGFVVAARGWRWTQWTTLCFIAAAYVPVLFTRETYKKTILRRRARKLGIAGPLVERRSPLQSVRYFTTILLARPVHMLFTEPVVTLVCLYSGFLFGLLYTFVIASPWVYENYYGFDVAGQSLSFLGLMIGTISAPIPLVLLDHFVYQPRLKHFQATHPADARFPPEHRLYPALIGSVLFPAWLFLFAWTARPSVHWIFPIIFQGFAMQASVMIYAPSNLFMIDAYGPLYGASAAGAAMLSRYTFSAAFPLFTLQMYKALGVGWATSLLGFCTVAMAPIPWLFWRCGERIRAGTKYETSM